MNSDIISKIEPLKEVFSAMPLKTKKHRETYLKDLEKSKSEFEEYKLKVKAEINSRVNKIKKAPQDSKIAALNKSIAEIESGINLINKNMTSYELMNLDRICYGLNYYYKDNWLNINNLIDKGIKAFEKVGIKLNAEYFDYSHYAYEYMNTFFKEEIGSGVLHKEFERLYWLCPDLIKHIELNFNYLYYKFEKDINNYYANQKREYLKTLAIKEEDIYTRYFALKREKFKIEKINQALLLNNVINKKFEVNGLEAKVNNYFNTLIVDKEAFEKNKDVYIDNFIKLENNLYEYRNFLEYKFLIDDIKTKYSEKDKYKGLLEADLKKIVAAEKELRKLNLNIAKLKSKGKVEKERIDALLKESNQKILELKTLYRELEINKFNDKVLNILGPHSTIYDILHLADSNYYYLTNLIIKINPEINEEEITAKVDNLIYWINNPFNNMITNMGIAEEKDLSFIITDRYYLYGINVKKMLMEGNVEITHEMIKLISFYLCIEKSGLKITDLEFLINTINIWQDKP